MATKYNKISKKKTKKEEGLKHKMRDGTDATNHPLPPSLFVPIAPLRDSKTKITKNNN